MDKSTNFNLPVRIERPLPKDIIRFMRKVWKSPSGCWKWTGWTTKKGYGQFDLETGGKHRRLCAHRVSFAIFNGVCPEELVIHHECKHPWCVNPDHLEAITPEENTRLSNEP